MNDSENENGRDSDSRFYNDFQVEISDKKKNSKYSNNKYIIFGISAIIFLIILAIIILIITKRGNNEDDQEYEKVGEINCTYYINSTSNEIQLIYDDYKKENNFGLYIDGTKKNIQRNIDLHLWESIKFNSLYMKA